MEFAEMGVRGWNQGGGWSIVPLELTPHAGILLVWPLPLPKQHNISSTQAKDEIIKNIQRRLILLILGEIPKNLLQK